MTVVGEAVNLRYLATDPITGDPAEPTVVLTVTDPDGNTSTPDVTNTDTGIYDASFTPDEAGTWYATWSATGDITDTEEVQVDVFDSEPLLYATLVEFNAFRQIQTSDPQQTMLSMNALSGACRLIDRTCGVGPGEFALDKTASARTYGVVNRVRTDADGTWLRVDAIGTTNGLVVETSTGVTTTDYVTQPDNAIVTGRPITWIGLTSGSWSRPRITARWGYPYVPPEIREAALILASRLLLRREKDMSGRNQDGSFTNQLIDPDVQNLLAPFQSLGVV